MTHVEVFSIKKAQGLPGPMLWHASKRWQRTLAAALAPVGLSSTNAVILVNLLHITAEGKSATQIKLAQLSGVDAMTTSAALRTLERKGYVTRTVDNSDKRAIQIHLTPPGKNTAHAALDIIAQTHEAFFSPLTPAERKTFIANLQALLENNKEVLWIYK